MCVFTKWMPDRTSQNHFFLQFYHVKLTSFLKSLLSIYKVNVDSKTSAKYEQPNWKLTFIHFVMHRLTSLKF